jgi:hypothetical protein
MLGWLRLSLESKESDANEARTMFPGQSKLSFRDFKILSVELMQSTN